MATITFITGQVDSGKTQTLQNRINALKPESVDGFTCIKRLDRKKHLNGYDLRHVTDGQTINALTIKTAEYAYQDYFLYGPYIFSKDAFYQAEMILKRALLDPNIETIVMDEIGQVEVMGLGYARILSEALKTDKHLFLCVNDDHLQTVIHHFDIDPKDILQIIHSNQKS